MRSFDVFFWFQLGEAVEKTHGLSVIWDTITRMWHHCDDKSLSSAWRSCKNAWYVHVPLKATTGELAIWVWRVLIRHCHSDPHSSKIIESYRQLEWLFSGVFRLTTKIAKLYITGLWWEESDERSVMRKEWPCDGVVMRHTKPPLYCFH